MKTRFMPLIVRALDMIKKGIQKYVNEISGDVSFVQIREIYIYIYLLLFLTPIILHLNFMFIQILYKHFYTALYKILYIQYLHNLNLSQ